VSSTLHKSVIQHGYRIVVADQTFARFALVGLSNFAVSFTVFRIAMALMPAVAMRAGLSQSLSYGAGIAWSYIWNRTFTFRSRSRVAPQVVRFIALQLGLLLISSAALFGLVDRVQWPATTCWVLVMTVVTLVNFVLMRTWVYR